MSEVILSLMTDRGEAAIVRTARDLQRDLARSDIPVQAVEEPSRPGEKGDVFSLGQLALVLVTSGAVTALLQCLKAYLERDKSLTFRIKRPDGSSVELTSRNMDDAEVRAQIESVLSES